MRKESRVENAWPALDVAGHIVFCGGFLASWMDVAVLTGEQLVLLDGPGNDYHGWFRGAD